MGTIYISTSYFRIRESITKMEHYTFATLTRSKTGITFAASLDVCHLTALGPLSSYIYTTSLPSTLSRPIYTHTLPLQR
jgi:hypothetical protein